MNLTIFEGRRFTVSLSIPAPTRRRLTGTAALCSAFTGTLLTPALFFPGADLSPKLVGIAFLVPFGVGSWSLFWAERRVRADAVPLREGDEYPQRAFHEPQSAEQPTVVMHPLVPVTPERVIDGEVVR
jgi:hypothetical protein